MKKLLVIPDEEEYAIALLDTGTKVRPKHTKAMLKWMHPSWRWLFDTKIKDWSKIVAICTMAAGRRSCHNLFVVKSHRGQGLGTLLYDKVEDYFGFKLRPSRIQTKHGVAFWKRRKLRNKQK